MEGVLVKIYLSLIFEPRLRWNPMRGCNFRCGVTLVNMDVPIIESILEERRITNNYFWLMLSTRSTKQGLTYCLLSFCIPKTVCMGLGTV